MNLHKEIEAKFYLPDLNPLRQRLERMGGQIISERHHEFNLRFDTPDSSLQRRRDVLRLRQDNQARLTFKTSLGTFEERTEIEVIVDDADSARALLEALGYQVVFIYEKQRTVYGLDQACIMLDELPFGTFVEIEAPTAEDVARLAAELRLNWERRLRSTYFALFEKLHERLSLPFRQATFANFQRLAPVSADVLGLIDASLAAKPVEGES